MSEEDIKHWLDYSAQFIGNTGNFKSFGDSKFIPRIPQDKVAALAKTNAEAQKLYESFLLIHVTCQVAALVVLFFHHPGARPYVGAALGIWTLDRLVWRLLIKRRSFISTLQIAPDKQTVLLSLSIPLRAKKFPHQDITAGWHPGQHIFITIPSLGPSHILQTHPFTHLRRRQAR